MWTVEQTEFQSSFACSQACYIDIEIDYDFWPLLLCSQTGPDSVAYQKTLLSLKASTWFWHEIFQSIMINVTNNE